MWAIALASVFLQSNTTQHQASAVYIIKSNCLLGGAIAIRKFK
ncbi:hypothetical protein ACE1AT_27675 [Pelatocladus sp. BLCC-F211]